VQGGYCLLLRFAFRTPSEEAVEGSFFWLPDGEEVGGSWSTGLLAEAKDVPRPLPALRGL